MKKISTLKYLKTFHHVASNLALRSGVYPLYASLKVTGRCALQCPYCDMPLERSDQPELPLRDIQRILRDLGSSSVFVLTLEGGEPFLHPDIGEVLRYASRQPYYVAVVTSARGFDLDRIREYQKWIDFLHLSIDETHGNLELLSRLDTFRLEWPAPSLAVQSVVGNNELDAMDGKARFAHEAGIQLCYMPAAELVPGIRCYPDPIDFRSRVGDLKRRYPETVITSESFLHAINASHGCSSASIIIDYDGGLFYPCRTLGHKPVNLLSTTLHKFIKSPAARRARREMDDCRRSCGWYQYFAVSYRSFADLPRDLKGSLERTRRS